MGFVCFLYLPADKFQIECDPVFLEPLRTSRAPRFGWESLRRSVIIDLGSSQNFGNRESVVSNTWFLRPDGGDVAVKGWA